MADINFDTQGAIQAYYQARDLWLSEKGKKPLGVIAAEIDQIISPYIYNNPGDATGGYTWANNMDTANFAANAARDIASSTGMNIEEVMAQTGRFDSPGGALVFKDSVDRDQTGQGTFTYSDPVNSGNQPTGQLVTPSLQHKTEGRPWYQGVMAVALPIAMMAGAGYLGSLGVAPAAGGGTAAATTAAEAGAWAASMEGTAAGIGSVAGATAGGTALSTSVSEGLFGSLTAMEKAKLVVSAVGLASSLGGTPEAGQLESPGMSDEEKQLLALQSETIKNSLEQQGLWDAEAEKYYQDLLKDSLLSPEEELSIDKQYDLEAQAFRDKLNIEGQRIGNTQLAELTSRGVLESTTGENAIARTQSEFADVLMQGESAIEGNRLTAKTDLDTAKRSLAQSGYNLTSQMSQNQMNTALEASMYSQNYLMGNRGLQASTNLQNALLTQASEKAKYDQRLSLWKGVANLGTALFA